MLPTIGGRYQTRTFLVLFIGVPWTLLITPILPGLSGLTLGQKYTSTFVTLGWVLLLGYLWEPLYHYIQYQRWEKDWPILFAFLVFINEGILVWVVVGVLDLNPYPPPVLRLPDPLPHDLDRAVALRGRADPRSLLPAPLQRRQVLRLKGLTA